MREVGLAVVPEIRVRRLNNVAVRSEADYVLYWMTAYRRLNFNYALDRAIEWGEKLRRPVLIVEALRTNYRWNCDRFHRFIIEGMYDNRAAIQRAGVTYFPYVEEEKGVGSGLVESLAQKACLLVSDDFPSFFHPKLYDRIVRHWQVHAELVDSNVVLPMRLGDKTFTVAHSYRRFMQKQIPAWIDQLPESNPLERASRLGHVAIPDKVSQKWQSFEFPELSKLGDWIAQLPIDHSVPPVETCPGGTNAANHAWQRFLSKRLNKYSEDRNEPSRDGSSWLSPYLHFGHISPHQIFSELQSHLGWNPSQMGKPNGKMTGFWNMSDEAEAFLDQLLTWREIGFNMCSREPDFDRYQSLPDWARKTLAEHQLDNRPYVYSLEEFEKGKTHDELWNAAQNQLRQEGRIHNYLRMLWGKKILHWSDTPEVALKTMIHLNNKYALDGRNPNSYSGIFWVMGRYDRAWGPERPVFGKIRYMTSESTRSKYKVADYLKKFG